MLIVIDTVEQYVQGHDGKWPTSWKELEVAIPPDRLPSRFRQAQDDVEIDFAADSGELAIRTSPDKFTAIRPIYPCYHAYDEAITRLLATLTKMRLDHAKNRGALGLTAHQPKVTGTEKQISKTISGGRFRISFEGWGSIIFDCPSLSEGDRASICDKVKAEAVISRFKDEMLPAAEIILIKSAELPKKALMDEVQAWLSSQGIKDIDFKMASGFGEPPLVREYRDGKITEYRNRDP